MGKKIIPAVLLTLVNIISYPQEMPLIMPGDHKGLNITRSVHYDGNSLWGYMNGGADLYLEYGFDQLVVQEYEHAKQKYKAEIFRMNDAPAAFGIYSALRYRCPVDTVLTDFCCINPYQVLLARGRYLVSITNNTGAADGLDYTIHLAQGVLGTINEPAFTLGEIPAGLFTREELHGIKFARGPLGIQNACPDLEPVMEGYSNYELYRIPVVRETFQGYALMIRFGDRATKDRFLAIPALPDTDTAANHPESFFLKIDRPGNEILFIKAAGDHTTAEQWISVIQQ